MQATDRQRREDVRHMDAAIKDHGRYALGRLAVQMAWAVEDVEAARQVGDATRAAMKQARADRLQRVIAELRRTGRGQ